MSPWHWDTLPCVYSFINVCHSILYKVSLKHWILHLLNDIYINMWVSWTLTVCAKRHHFKFTSLLQKMWFWFIRTYQWLRVHVHIEALLIDWTSSKKTAGIDERSTYTYFNSEGFHLLFLFSDKFTSMYTKIKHAHSL